MKYFLSALLLCLLVLPPVSTKAIEFRADENGVLREYVREKHEPGYDPDPNGDVRIIILIRIRIKQMRENPKQSLNLPEFNFPTSGDTTANKLEQYFRNEVDSGKTNQPKSSDFFNSLGHNGPQLAGSIVDIASAFSSAFNSHGPSDLEREMKYAPSDINHYPSDSNWDDKYLNFLLQLYKNQRAENLKRIEELEHSLDLNGVRDQAQRLQRLSEELASELPDFEEGSSDSGVEAEQYSPLELDLTGLADSQISYLQAAHHQVQLLAHQNPFLETPSQKRWERRVQDAHAYYTDESIRESYAKLPLSPHAKSTFFLDEMVADSFENYELIRAANKLSREPDITSDPFRYLKVATSLKQAHLFAEEGESFSSSMALENALAVLDFTKGLATGFSDNVYDTVSGIWHLVSHPIDSVSSVASAIINYEETYELIVNKVGEVIDEFPSYSAEEKGNLIGNLVTEAAAIVFTGGGKLGATAAKEAKLLSTLLKESKLGSKVLTELNFSSAIAKATEEIASKMAKGINLSRFENAYMELSKVGKTNVEFLRKYAKEQGYVSKRKNPLGNIEEWGVIKPDGIFEWRVKIKPEPGLQSKLHANSKMPRAAVRLDSKGNFFNPFTNEKCPKIVGGHLELEKAWL